MRKFIFLFTISMLIFGCKPKNPNGYTLDGRIDIDSLNGKWVYLVPSFKEIDMVIDSCQIQKGKFTFNGDVGYSSYLALMLVTDSNRVPVAPLVGANVVIEPGIISVSFNEKREPNIGGTPQNNLIQRCDDAISQFNERCESIANDNKLSPAEKYNAWYEARLERNSVLLQEIEPSINSEKVQTLFYEYYIYFTREELEQIERKMNESTRSKSKIQSALKSKHLAVGERYADFILPDLTGTPTNLSSFVGKTDYLYIDFWASWCAPCIREIKQVIPLYEQSHSSHFEMIGVSLEDRKSVV